MADRLDLLMYLDESLVRNLSSAFFDGYIDIRTHKEINDKSISGKIHFENKEQFYEEDRYFKDIREGYKGKNYGEVGTYQNNIENDKAFETSEFFRREDEIKQIYTSFGIHNQLINGLYKKKMLREINDKTICNSEMVEGEYIELRGDITTISIVYYLDILIDILTCYGTDDLNILLNNKELGKLNYTKILNLLTHLLELLTKNGTQDLIVKCNTATLIITVNTKFFLNENASIFDKVNCPCKIVGKVMKTCADKQKISLLRKTSQFEYYEKLMQSIKPFLDLLESNGIILPNMPNLTITEKYLLIIPLGIYI